MLDSSTIEQAAIFVPGCTVESRDGFSNNTDKCLFDTGDTADDLFQAPKVRARYVYADIHSYSNT